MSFCHDFYNRDYVRYLRGLSILHFILYRVVYVVQVYRWSMVLYIVAVYFLVILSEVAMWSCSVDGHYWRAGFTTFWGLPIPDTVISQNVWKIIRKRILIFKVTLFWVAQWEDHCCIGVSSTVFSRELSPCVHLNC